MAMDAETTVKYLEHLILAERDFSGAADLARMNLHRPLTQEVLDGMQQLVTCGLSRLGAAQDLNLPPIPVEVPAVADEYTDPVTAPPVAAPPTDCCGGCGCDKPADADAE